MHCTDKYSQTAQSLKKKEKNGQFGEMVERSVTN